MARSRDDRAVCEMWKCWMTSIKNQPSAGNKKRVIGVVVRPEISLGDAHSGTKLAKSFLCASSVCGNGIIAIFCVVSLSFIRRYLWLNAPSRKRRCEGAVCVWKRGFAIRTAAPANWIFCLCVRESVWAAHGVCAGCMHKMRIQWRAQWQMRERGSALSRKIVRPAAALCRRIFPLLKKELCIIAAHTRGA